ncbi:MAG: MaoC family dehydratase N-terminal domain-containing protein [Chloroflexi bacterium]|nr:MaoC family dehydratase N-terminal domain-containing protein [Chloroflexota bacterium]
MGDGLITDEALEQLRSRIGSKMRIRNIFNELASKDAIRHFADGVGDPNPLWRDEQYARETRYGRIVAPPSWIFSVFPAWVQQGLRGVGGFHSGTEVKFFKPIVEGDVIKPECVFTGFEEKPSRFAGRMIMEHQEGRYFNQKDELVARTKVWIARVERAAGRKTGKYTGIELPHPWRERELRDIEEQVLAEEVRGAKPRYWEDVSVGDDLGPVVKGPFGLTDMIAYCVGAAPIDTLAHHVALRKYRDHPSWAFRDPATSALEPIYGVHYNKAAANAMGLPYPYDVGIQRHCWLIHLLTNWAGDDGWIKRNRAEYRHFVYMSDVVWLRGKVTRKYVEDGETCVDVETSAFNQRGENTMPGEATFVLPSKARAYHPLDTRVV